MSKQITIKLTEQQAAELLNLLSFSEQRYVKLADEADEAGKTTLANHRDNRAQSAHNLLQHIDRQVTDAILAEEAELMNLPVDCVIDLTYSEEPRAAGFHG